eukprot:TRINITY_DN4900_c0_g1_i1.p1 TRINITY_DN4900_c0_g1~~TRINITY_DN4900_c0_g1_i1.p1  ORF type:complete len:176 (-),score=28.14 TRINITY_DN4900_c0_g1_i1:142-600(-)
MSQVIAHQLQKFAGGCHCGNLSVVVQLTKKPSTCTPRACDCSFCTGHGAHYLSDPQGKMTLFFKEKSLFNQYSFASQNAKFCLCGNCGILVGCLYEEGGRRFGTVNVNALTARVEFPAAEPASPQLLTPEQKIGRWKQLWFPDVQLEHLLCL